MTENFQAMATLAAAKMRQVFPETPLMRNEMLSERFGADIWLKREDLSPVRSYKLRGAFNAMRKVIPDQTMFVCASAGNHAQGVAFMCKHFQVHGVVFMPVTTPEQKILKTRMFGGDHVEVRLIGDYFDESLKAAQDFCAEKGAHFLSPFDDEDVIEGQASVAVEIEQQLGGLPDHIILPVGGGGLSAGVRGYFDDTVRYTFVEPSGAKSLAAALEEGAPVDVSPINSFVDGAAVAKIGARTFARLKGISPNDVMDLAEDRICNTIVEMLNVEGVVLEPAGAMSIEALGEVADQIKGKTVVCVTSGGNFDFERLPEVKERAQRYAGLKKYFILRLPQRPGALRDFLDTLGPHDNITRFEYMKKSARNFGSVLIGIETDAPQNFPAMFGRIDAGGFTYTDITNDETLAQFVI
ncbi:threonine ammonia-lyase IlvA [Sulfitobacter mediterraneus]|jgi:threonine dehydratase|uniref:threonine ammonia-lyase IlvA n=1 Tax=Sulfitobacter TaxID=60136 RepID=UPI001933580A|nr:MULTISPECIES: threonine ammonia-lyase IlvA [Sulfitobacter]MBM1632963.1 threonine ammonia-lyase IlvA [Sulfitobacter mediterraneus]MBM1640903.1 threonine ammonia-lyase IlvA [Sulfitobacter mediterraneus]MBM1644828.1 threonine ammonia-lyase IlvA [Sulfitobacter mediterraneus]MBM1649023.1 threonine ammonia-lyase IlvA [Sulfitobacter mediterraneus]MBM1653044.1 threonine ammonia-lyase IlvA [Sulfitobacter mediterraneus]